MDFRIIKTVELLQANFQKDLNFDDLAQEVNLSPSRLRHLFKSETGLSPTQYLKALRMEKAKDLGENTFLRVKEIMSSVGLNNSSHFTRDFKRAHGLTPTEHRRRAGSKRATGAERGNTRIATMDKK